VAEDPFNNFLPSVGRVVLAREPAGPGIRVESALYDGVEVTPYYDSLLAKVTAWGRNREGARTRLRRALSEFRIVGVATNIPYIREILDLPDFIEGKIDTEFLDRHEMAAADPVEELQEMAEIAALLLVTGGEAAERPTNGAVAPAALAPRQPSSTWRSQMTGSGVGRGVGRWTRNI